MWSNPSPMRCASRTVSVSAPARGGLTEWANGPSLALPQPLPEPDRIATLQYTGGTTGRSKGANLTHRSIAVNISQREALVPVPRDGQRLLCVMPLFHVYAVAMCLHNMVYAGGTLVIVPRYTPDAVFDLIEQERITIFAGSPTLFIGLMAHPRFGSIDFSRLDASYSGSAALPEELLRRWEAATGAPVIEGYGQSEAGPVISFNPLQGQRRPGSVGVPVPGTDVQIVDLDEGDARCCGVGEKGEIRVRGPQVMSGYRNLPEETAATLRGGWLYTGDIGEVDSDGYLFIRDRKKEMAGSPVSTSTRARSRSCCTGTRRCRRRRSSRCPTPTAARSSKGSWYCAQGQAPPLTNSWPIAAATSRSTSCRRRCTWLGSCRKRPSGSWTSCS